MNIYSTDGYQDFYQTFPTPHFLINPPNTTDFINHKLDYIIILKNWITNLNTYLHQLLTTNTHQNTMANLMPSLLTFRSQFFDNLLSKLFCIFNDNSSLFALAGYARNELFPYSDLDLLILYDDNSQLSHLQDFIALLWDIGINPAIRMHHINDKKCVSDITIATSLLENRFLFGNKTHKNLPLIWLKTHYCAKEFFHQKFSEYQNRHNKQGNSEYMLEPDIKESVGGLRDIHFLHWIAKFYFNLPPTATLQDLVQKNFLTKHECTNLMNAKHFLWLIRHYLHTLSGRDTNKLDFGNQKTIAQLLNYPNDNHNPNYAPECLMKDYYRAVMIIASLSESLGQLFFNEFLGEVHKQPLTDDYFIAQTIFGQQLGIYDEQLFDKNPCEILTIFLLMGQQGIKNLSPKTLRALRNCTHLINQDFLNNPNNRALFLQNLKEGNYLFHRLRLMKRTGVLGAYLPDFVAITGLMQYDLFHRYTVDAHTLLLIRLLHRFGRDDSFGVVGTVYQGLDDKLPLVIAALFHDIAKGKNGDHSELGADLVADFCQRHNLNSKDSQLVQWLVRHHLVMSITAQKKDIDDPKIINEFANFVGDIRHLDFLYVLTVADMNATNSQLWNNWRATLLKKLYLSTHHALHTGQTALSPSTLIADNQHKAIALLRLKLQKTLPNFATKTQYLWDNFPQEYFLKYTAQTIAWHTHALLHHSSPQPLILIRPHKDKSLHAHELFIYTANKPNLFALTVMVLDQFGFAVYSADILTDRSNFALDGYVIVNKNLANQSIFDDRPSIDIHNNSDELVAFLHQHLPNPNAFFAQAIRPKKQRSNLRLQHFTIKTQVFFENTAEQHRLHIITKDRPALLANIGQTFGELGIWVHSAKITTLGERAEDVFVVSDPCDQALTPKRQNEIISTLKARLDD